MTHNFNVSNFLHRGLIMRKLSACILVLFFLISLFCGNVFAGKLKLSPDKPIKMRVGLDDPAQLKYQDYIFGRVFKSVVETRTNGAIIVELFPNRALGSWILLRSRSVKRTNCRS